MSEYRITSADIAIRCDATIDDLIDVLEAKSRRYIPVIYALNKIDSISIEELDLLYRIPNACPISSEHGWNVDELLEQMWEKLNLRRVYTKPKGKQPDYTAPVVLRSTACTVEDFVRASSLFVFFSFVSFSSFKVNMWNSSDTDVVCPSVTPSTRRLLINSKWRLSMGDRSNISPSASVSPTSLLMRILVRHTLAHFFFLRCGVPD